MDALEKILGKGIQTVTGADATAVKTNYAAYALRILVADTQITSITENVEGVLEDNTTESWMNKNRPLGNYIPLRYPITSITLNEASDEVDLYLMAAPPVL